MMLFVEDTDADSRAELFQSLGWHHVITYRVHR